jgi:hypothetical protein
MRGAVIMSGRPAALHRDANGNLHCESGPALAYPDGWGFHAWHGVRVPADLIDPGWDTGRILAERNAEIRRCAIERTGWDVFIAASGMKPAGECPDPGNDGQVITLYDLPEQLADLYDAPARILLCANGTVERDGTRRRFALPVPSHHKDPVEAAAELYGWPAEAYRKLARRA